MKKISLVLATAGLSASLGAYAAIPTDAKPFQVIVPNIKAGPEIILEGLLLRPHNDDLNYALVSETVSGTAEGFVFTDTDTSVEQANPKYNFGFRVALGYVFPDSGNDVLLSWTHFSRGRTSDTFAAPGEVLFTPLGNEFANVIDPINDFPTAPGTQPTAESQVNFRYDAVDLDVGQYLDVGTRLRLRMFSGLRLARVKNNISSDYSAAFEAGVGDETIINILELESDDFESKFSGIGPRFGLDSSYHLGYCFGLVAHVSGALLVGKVSSSADTNFTEIDTVTVGDITFTDTAEDTRDVSVSKQTRVVPAFDAKLGLDWSYIVPSNQSVISIEVGYQWTKYINVIDRYRVTDPDVDISAQSLIPLEDGAYLTKSISSVGFDGPYLNLSWKI